MDIAFLFGAALMQFAMVGMVIARDRVEGRI
jgi:hypothetical protein